ncbi:MAG: 30S ribosomal protein S8 [Thaumarchaeota archaeon]|jgi:small subunit ribosomal protein S8|nr:30S ribosomal protein S8 [Candidatus Terraquivivens yellowstonensis]
MARKRECIYPASKLIANVLKVLQKHGYIGAFEYIEDGRGGKFRIQLLGRINRSAPIKPHFSVRKDEFEKWEEQYLPGKDIGILIVTTPKGVMAHTEARSLGIGGRLLGYVY